MRSELTVHRMIPTSLGSPEKASDNRLSDNKRVGGQWIKRSVFLKKRPLLVLVECTIIYSTRCYIHRNHSCPFKYRTRESEIKQIHVRGKIEKKKSVNKPQNSSKIEFVFLCKTDDWAFAIFTWNVIACFFLWTWNCFWNFSWCVKRSITYAWNCFRKTYRTSAKTNSDSVDLRCFIEMVNVSPWMFALETEIRLAEVSSSSFKFYYFTLFTDEIQLNIT